MTEISTRAAAPALTLKRVLLSSGIGCFEYEAEVDGPAVLPLTVKLDQVDDVLKSAVVYDSKGGVGDISLPGQDPLSAVFRELPFDQGAVTSLVALLGSLRGAEVEAEQTGRAVVTGRVVGVQQETSVQEGGRGAVVRHRLSVMAAEGIKQFIVEDLANLSFKDAKVRAQVEQALKAIAAHGERDRRTLSVRVTGEGKRKVRVAYVVATPLWKASYRLTMGAPDAVAAHIQGWAVLENQSGEDWTDVELVLASGNPVTFKQRLYQSYYVDRQEVAVEVAGRIMPRTDEGTVARKGIAPGARAALRSARPMAFAAAAPMAAAAGGLECAMAFDAEEALEDADAFDYASAAVELGEAKENGSQVEFTVPGRVSVANGHSLMVPVIDREIPAARFALYQPETHQRHPLATIEITNDGATGLPPGVVTLFERGEAGVSYVGDAKLSALPAGDQRLISYALDQKVSIDTTTEQTETVASITAVKGEVTMEGYRLRPTTYRVKGPAREDRKVVIEHGRLSGWDLEQDGTAEMTTRAYRLPVELKAGEQADLVVTLRSKTVQTYRLGTANGRWVEVFLETNAAHLKGKLRKGLNALKDLLAAVDEKRQALSRLELESREAVTEQQRISASLRDLGGHKDSDYGARMLKKLDELETQIEASTKAIKEARSAVEAAQKAAADHAASVG